MALKPLDTFGYCQRPVFFMQKNKPVKISTKLVVEVARESWKKKHPFVTQVACFQIPWMRDISRGLEFNSTVLVKNNYFLEKLRDFRGSRFSQSFNYKQMADPTKVTLLHTVTKRSWFEIVRVSSLAIITNGVVRFARLEYCSNININQPKCPHISPSKMFPLKLITMR